MSSLGASIELGREALRAQQIGLNVAGNNIANVNTPGYARKQAKLESKTNMALGSGTGVLVAGLTRVRDRFLDSQFRFERGDVGRLESLEQAMATVEAIFTEVAGGSTSETGAVFDQPGGASLNGAFSRFFNAFQDLANTPDSQAARAEVREEAVLLTEQFHRMHNSLTALRDEVEGEFRETVKEINQLTKKIAELNVKIVTTKAKPNFVAGNLEDERDRLIDDLSRLLDMSVREESDGTLAISGMEGEGVLLVTRGISTDLGIRGVVQDNALVSHIVFADTDELVPVSNGKLKGLLETRDEKIPSFQASLDLLAETLVTRINQIHSGGFGLDGSSGNLFFQSSGINARLIGVSQGVLDDLNKISVASPSETSSSFSAGSGDGSVALALSDLRLEKILSGSTRSMEEFYSDLVGRVGAEAREVYNNVEARRLVLEQITSRRENNRGVSINEEASDLILFQRAYQAAARLVSMVDEMMEMTLNM